jgi:hypothetical protein
MRQSFQFRLRTLFIITAIVGVAIVGANELLQVIAYNQEMYRRNRRGEGVSTVEDDKEGYYTWRINHLYDQTINRGQSSVAK